MLVTQIGRQGIVESFENPTNQQILFMFDQLFVTFFK